jgi:hypothetical protein
MVLEIMVIAVLLAVLSLLVLRNAWINYQMGRQIDKRLDELERRWQGKDNGRN